MVVITVLKSEHIINYNKGTCKINTPIVLYRNDKNVEVKLFIRNNPFTCNSPTSYAQLILYNKDSYIATFTDVVPFIDNTASFVLVADMLNDINEVGLYTIQLRIYSEDKVSVATLPPVEQGLEVRNPIAIEGDKTK